jgi:nucleoid-associated protein YgaU
VSRFQKIFLATALVVIGFGVARYLGQPVLRTGVLASPNRQLSTFSRPPDFSSATQAVGHVRLLPDSTATLSGAPAMSRPTAMAGSPSLGHSIAPVGLMNEATGDAARRRVPQVESIASTPIGSSDAPRARLRNEAPRALGIDPQSPAAIRRLPADDGTAANPYRVANPTAAVPTSWTAPPLLNAGFVDNRVSSLAMPASYTATTSSMHALTDNSVSPPPWPAPEETSEPRMHIVVDGDSLERLASRYLSDPRRGREIYELNRDKLSSPDLLPIGVELKIPDRVVAASWVQGGVAPNAANVRSGNNLDQTTWKAAPPPASTQGIVPRAQLAAPVMVQ